MTFLFTFGGNAQLRLCCFFSRSVYCSKIGRFCLRCRWLYFQHHAMTGLSLNDPEDQRLLAATPGATEVELDIALNRFELFPVELNFLVFLIQLACLGVFWDPEENNEPLFCRSKRFPAPWTPARPGKYSSIFSLLNGVRSCKKKVLLQPRKPRGKNINLKIETSSFHPIPFLGIRLKNIPLVSFELE